MRTQVCIIGGGPSGLLLSQLLHGKGIESVLLERRSRDHVEGRIRAGVLEWGTVELLREAGVGDRMDREGIPHEGAYLALQNRGFRVDFEKRAGKRIMIYGQTEITRDLYAAREAAMGVVIHEAEGVAPSGLDTDSPSVAYSRGGVESRVDCDFVVGCDGFHGVSRSCIPKAELKEFERVYPFGWLGVLSETPPVAEELIYANHPRGFALCSMRNANLSRYYIQCPADEPPCKWSDEAFWDELRRRIPEEAADRLIVGPSVEKSVAPLRSFVAEPMRWGRLLLCGDAAHIVPPTGAKGLNLAASDAHYACEALARHYEHGDMDGVVRYSEKALARVWKAIRFSWWFTTLMHRFPDQSDFDQRIRETEIEALESSANAQAVLAENYVGLPY